MTLEDISKAVRANFMLMEDPNGKNKLYCSPLYEEDSEAAVVAAIGIAKELQFSEEEIMDEHRIYEKDEILYKIKRFFAKLKTDKLRLEVDEAAIPRFRNKVTLIYNYFRLHEIS